MQRRKKLDLIHRLSDSSSRSLKPVYFREAHDIISSLNPLKANCLTPHVKTSAYELFVITHGYSSTQYGDAIYTDRAEAQAAIDEAVKGLDQKLNLCVQTLDDFMHDMRQDSYQEGREAEMDERE